MGVAGGRGTDLQKVASEDELDAAKELVVATHTPGKLLQQVKLVAGQHAGLVDDQASHRLPSMLDVALAEDVVLELLHSADARPETSEAVERDTAAGDGR